MDIQQFYRKYIPQHQLLLKKLPVFDLKNILKLPCNIDNIDSEKTKEELIDSTKKLREFMLVKEKTACSKCIHKSTCKFFELGPNKQKENYTQYPNLFDLQLILHGLYKTSVNSMETSANNLLDLDKNNERNNTHNNKNTNTNTNTTNSNYSISDENENITHVKWTSANIIVENLKETIDDLINHNGIIYKTLLNLFIESKNNIELTYKNPNDIEANKENKEEIDPITKLMEDLKFCKNRKERKRLLAIYNKKVGFALGEHSKIMRVDNSKEDEQGFEEYQRLELLKREKLHEKSNINNNKQNTIVYEGNRFIRTATQFKLNNNSLIKQKFIRKLNIPKAKTLALKNQADFALLLNSKTDVKSNVMIPNEEYNRSIVYLENKLRGDDNKEEVMDSFTKNVDKAKDKYSVDFNVIRNTKLNKLDKGLEENKNITLLSVKNKKERLEIEVEQTKSHQLALQDFTSNTINQHLLQNQNDYDYDNNENHSNNNIISSNNKSSLVPNSKTNKVAKADKADKSDLSIIKIEKLENKGNKESKANLEIFVQKNIKRTAKENLMRSLAKEKSLLKNKHVYKAQHLYNNSNLEGLLYEKDTDVSRALRYEKKIKKD